MAIKPIPFNTEMVRAILNGQKTQTRRVVKGIDGLNVYRAEPSEDSYESLSEWDFLFGGYMSGGGMYDAFQSVKAPCGIGDILWVRETWVENKNPQSEDFGGYEYRADYCEAICQELICWRPSIHMPKEAARIFLRVTDVKAGQLRGITDDDAMQEGVQYTDFGMYTPDWKMSTDGGKTFQSAAPIHRPGYHVGIVTDSNQCLPTARSAYAKLWDSTIKKADLPRYGWHANPWVWVIEFERCEKPEGWCE